MNLKNKENGPVPGKTGFPRVVFSRSLIFLAEFPPGAWRLTMYTSLPWLVRPMGEGAEGGAYSAIQAGTGGLHKWFRCLVLEFIHFPRKPSYSASFLH